MSDTSRRPPYLRLVVSNPPPADPTPEPETEPDVAFELDDDAILYSGIEESPYSALLHGDLPADLRQQALHTLWRGDGILWEHCCDDIHPSALLEAALDGAAAERTKEGKPSRGD